MPVEISTQLSDLADEFNPSSDSPKPDLDSSAPLEDGAITQVPDESMMSEELPSQDVPSYVGEYSDTNPVEVVGDNPEPVMIDEPVVYDNYREDPADYIFDAEKDNDRVDIAAMPFADYLEWLFPPDGEKGHKDGMETLEMVWGNLMAAGYDVEMRKVKIAAALWSRRHYTGNNVKSERYILQRVPASKLISFIPPSLPIKDWEYLGDEMDKARENSPQWIAGAEDDGDDSDKKWIIGISAGAAILGSILMMRK
jgi:hypothetical protein